MGYPAPESRTSRSIKICETCGENTFAWDNLNDETAVMKGIELLINAGFTKASHVLSFYVLAGYNTTFEQDVYRAQTLKDNGVQAFVMPFKRTREIRDLARWANRPELFWSTSFSEYKKGLKP